MTKITLIFLGLLLTGCATIQYTHETKSEDDFKLDLMQCKAYGLLISNSTYQAPPTYKYNAQTGIISQQPNGFNDLAKSIASSNARNECLRALGWIPYKK